MGHTSLAASSCETLCVRIVGLSQRINLLVVYRPPPRANSVFFDEVSNLIDCVSNLPGDYIICGDFNVPGSASDLVDDRLSDVLADRDLIQHVADSTRVDRTSSNILDLLITENRAVVIVQDIKLTSVPFSDHLLVAFSRFCYVSS